MGPAKDEHQVLINPPMKKIGRHRTIKGETIAINHDWAVNYSHRGQSMYAISVKLLNLNIK